jgi:hypothetical protein
VADKKTTGGNPMKEEEIIMSCKGYEKNVSVYPALFALLQWTFCTIFNISQEKKWAVKEYIAHNYWESETPFGDEISYHHKAVREAGKILAPITPEMHTALNALACIVQILHRQGKISVESIITKNTAIITIECNVSELLPRGDVFKIIDEKTLCINLKNEAAE